MKNHPLREKVIFEVHARPFLELPSSYSLVSVAIVYDSISSKYEIYKKALELGTQIDNKGIFNSNFFYVTNGIDALRYESHNEFCAFTFYRFDNSDIAEYVLNILDSTNGFYLCGVEISSAPSKINSKTKSHDQFHRAISGSKVMGGSAKVWTDFYPNSKNGLTRVIIEDIDLTSSQRGRLSQRICEIEMYRHMALLGLPDAMMAMPTTTKLDSRLANISQRMHQEEPSNLLEELTDLAGEVENLAASTANRLGATEAYFSVLNKRIQELREIRIEGIQTISEFMDRRIDPARRTCSSAGQRIELLSSRVARTSQMIRSQVDLAIEQQMRDLLATLNVNAGSQLKLQSKLESFSVIVVTYYAFDLMDRSIRNIVKNDVDLDLALYYLSFSIPVISLVLWLYIRKILRNL